jgi:hypothetical protein
VTIAFGVPVKVTVALCPEQIVWFEAIVTVGDGITVITTIPVCGCVQPGSPVEVALTSAKVVVVVNEFVTEAVPVASSVMVWEAPFTVYETIALGVPVNVTVALSPEQMVAFDEILTTGAGTTVIVTVPETGWLHASVPVEATLTKV